MVGLVLGKFMPLTMGHGFLIDAALNYLLPGDKLVILVCSLKNQPIPGEVRYEWMCKAYGHLPNVHVVHVKEELPSYPEEASDFWDLWVDAIGRYSPFIPNTLFTSENYGSELAAKLGIEHMNIDQARQCVPISATQIRENPMKYWNLIHYAARPYFVKKVCVYGPESTGKTTLAQSLAQNYSTCCVPEYARQYLGDRHCEEQDIVPIAKGHFLREKTLINNANRVLFCDTDYITTAIYSQYYFGNVPEHVDYLIKINHYDLYLFLDIDVPWVEDSQRDCGHLRTEFRNIFMDNLINRGIAPVVIKGNWDERFIKAVEAVDKLLL